MSAHYEIGNNYKLTLHDMWVDTAPEDGNVFEFYPDCNDICEVDIVGSGEHCSYAGVEGPYYHQMFIKYDDAIGTDIAGYTIWVLYDGDIVMQEGDIVQVVDISEDYVHVMRKQLIDEEEASDDPWHYVDMNAAEVMIPIEYAKEALLPTE